MHAPVLVTPADANDPIITTAEAKLHCHIDGAEEDALVAALVAAATKHLDGYAGILGRALVTQTWRQNFDDFSTCFRLPLQAATISSITSQNTAGQIATITATNYALQEDALGSFVRFKDDYSFPSDLYQTKAIAVNFTAGYGAAAEVPEPIKQAMLLLIGHWYANREAVNVGNIVTPLPFAVDALLELYRRVGI
ncbi:MAG: head-tail connector protein [Hyphomicrobium sp.]|jgi:uncharacterized phiE125 gp8 family phage protein